MTTTKWIGKFTVTDTVNGKAASVLTLKTLKTHGTVKTPLMMKNGIHGGITVN